MRNIGFDYNEEADYGYGYDYYGEDGCCLICSDSEEGCSAQTIKNRLDEMGIKLRQLPHQERLIESQRR